MKRHRRDFDIISEMNLTNLLDTAFVLLIGFIIASPTMRQGLNVDLPQVAQAPTLQINEKTLVVQIRKPLIAGGGDAIYLEDRRISLEELQDEVEVQKRLNNGKVPDVAIEADRAAVSETLIRVISALRVKGVEGVGLPTEAMDLPPAPAEEPKLPQTAAP